MRTVALVALMTLAAGTARSSAMEELEIVEWASSVEHQAQSQLEQVLLPAAGVSPEELDWQLAVVADDGTGITAIAMVRKQRAGSVVGASVELTDGNLAQQLYRLRQSDLTLTVKGALPLVHRRSGRCSGDEANELVEAARGLEELTVPVLPRGPAATTGGKYRIRVATAPGGEREFVIPQDTTAPARWCERLFVALGKCPPVPS